MNSNYIWIIVSVFNMSRVTIKLKVHFNDSIETRSMNSHEHPQRLCASKQQVIVKKQWANNQFSWKYFVLDAQIEASIGIRL